MSMMSAIAEESSQDLMATEKAPAAPAPAPKPPQMTTSTLIEPPTGWQLVNVDELWRYRELLGFLVWRDVKVRYKQTVLGAAWAVLQPAMMMVVFTIFFARLANVSTGDIPYPLFVFAGLLPWSFFSTSISSAANSVVGSERLISKIYFPRLAVPFASVGAAVIDFCVALGMLLALLLWYGKVPGPAIVLAPVIFVFFGLAATGVGTLLAALNVAYRDFRYVVPFLVQLWMFATPTIYMDPSRNTDKFDLLLLINPLSPLVASFRACILGGPIPWGSLGIAATMSVAMFIAGCLYFRRVEDDFSDII